MTAKVEDQRLSDARRHVALDERDDHVEGCDPGGEQRELDDELAVVPTDAVVDDVAEDQRVERAEHRVDGDEAQEQREHLLVAERELEHALEDPGRELLREDALVATPRRTTHSHPPPPRIIGRSPVRRVSTRSRSVEQCGALGGVEGGEHLVGRLAAGGLDARHGALGVRGERHEHRAAVVGIGQPHDEAGRLERLDRGGRRARHDAEPGRDLRHPGWPDGAGDRAQEPGLRIREAERREPTRAVAAELRRDAGERLGEPAREVVFAG